VAKPVRLPAAAPVANLPLPPTLPNPADFATNIIPSKPLSAHTPDFTCIFRLSGRFAAAETGWAKTFFEFGLILVLS